MTLLNQIHCPDDLKKLKVSELKILAQEIRSRILCVMSRNGGHLASNLGSCELTLALHYVFDSPIDKLIFDVSHQTYTHKLVTGRNNERFDHIRKTKGLSGFAHPGESVHDHFFAGHAGTALSLSLGTAGCRDLNGEDFHVLPIIGDATLTCGLPFEALNNIRKDISRFIVVLNDNEMSISKNVGKITQILGRLISSPATSKVSHELRSLISKIPFCGSSLAKYGEKFASSFKNLFGKAPFFEQFDLSYIGPIDGHNLKELIPVFQSLKNLPMPVLVHVVTKKGNGVNKAEKDPIAYHGAKPFDVHTCEFLPAASKKPTFPKLFGTHLVKMGAERPNLVVVTPAMSLGSCLDPFQEKFKERFFDTGISEGHAVTFSGGLGKGGKLQVICSIYATFLQRALDNLFHDICLQDIPVIFAIDRAGFATGDGATHHGIYEMGFLRTMPKMVICAPRNGQLLVELLESATDWKKPTAIRYPNLETTDYSYPLRQRPLGKGELLTEGDDLLIIALGHCCDMAIELSNILLEKGISATVMDPIFVKPLDTDLLGKLLLKHARVVIIEEHSLKGGLSAEVTEFLTAFYFDGIELLNFGVPEIFLEHGSHKDLLNDCAMSTEKMLQKIMAHFSFSKKWVGEKK